MKFLRLFNMTRSPDGWILNRNNFFLTETRTLFAVRLCLLAFRLSCTAVQVTVVIKNRSSGNRADSCGQVTVVILRPGTVIVIIIKKIRDFITVLTRKLKRARVNT